MKRHRFVDDVQAPATGSPPTSLWPAPDNSREPSPAAVAAAMGKIPPPLVTAELNQILKHGPADDRAIHDRWAPKPRPWLWPK